MRIAIFIFGVLAVTALAALSPAERLNAKLQNLAQSAFEKEQWSEAYQIFLRLERTTENLPSLHFYLGRCAYEMGDYETAKTHFETVLKLKPKHPTASYELARTHLRYARRHEGVARELFATIPPSELPKEARRVVSSYTGFTRLPHGYRISGEFGFFAFLDSKAPGTPQLIDPELPLPDPIPANSTLEQSRGNHLTFNLKHRYQESQTCGFRWENKLESGVVNHPGINDSQAMRFYLGTQLGFRVDERFWFSPEYFVQHFSFSSGDRSFEREGWAINLEGSILNDTPVWGRLAWYKQNYDENSTSKHRGVSGEVGGRKYYGLHYAQMSLGVDIIHDAEAENEIGLYTQSRLSALWYQRFTPAAAGRIEGDFMLNNFDSPLGERKDKILAAGIGAELKVAEEWVVDYLVKLSRTEAEAPGSNQTRSLVRLGVRYTF